MPSAKANRSGLLCVIPGCSKPQGTNRLHYCNAHWRRWRNGQDLHAPMRAFTMAERLRQYTRVDPTTGCHVWIGHSAKGGYGVITYSKGKQKYAHRVVWELHNGPIPEGKFVLHHCDRTNCVNPAHLFLGDNQANMDDMAAKSRWANQSRRGARHEPFHKSRRRRPAVR